MKKNVGSVDRIARLVIGAVLIALPFVGNFAMFESSPYKLGAIIVGLVLVGTALTNFCPLYRLFGIRTCRV